jgi:quercetin 2,3-dioxygenase
MITVRQASERHHEQRRKREVWFTFYGLDRADPLAGGFGALEILNEDRLPPGASIPRHKRDAAEVVTYVREGALAYEDSLGRSGVIQSGEFQRMSVGRGLRHSEKNPSRSDWAQVFQLWLRPAGEVLERGHEQTRLSTAERRGALRVVASPDARRGSLSVRQDAFVFSVLLDPGQHVIHELAPGRRAWLHLIQGEVSLGELVLSTGDGAGFADERAASFTARAESELLLVDLGRP